MQEVPLYPEQENGSREPWMCQRHLWQKNGFEPWACNDGLHGCEPWLKLRHAAGMDGSSDSGVRLWQGTEMQGSAQAGSGEARQWAAKAEGQGSVGEAQEAQAFSRGGGRSLMAWADEELRGQNFAIIAKFKPFPSLQIIKKIKK